MPTTDAGATGAAPASDTRALIRRLDQWAPGHREGTFEGRRFGVTLHRSDDRRRVWLYGEERGGGDVVSANLYALSDGAVLLKPCEMPAEIVARFILGFVPDFRD